MWLWSKLTSVAWRDAWEERLQALAGTSLVVTEIPGRRTLRLDVYCQRPTEAARLKKLFGGTLRALKNRNWAALAVPRIQPIKIRNRFLVVSESDEKSLARHRAHHPERTVLSIPVEMAFGTGDHPTTATCLRLLCDLPLNGRRVLDLGCGTGILGLAAKKLGARRVLAVDFDPAAVAAARRNARRNGIRGVTIEQHDILAWNPDEDPFDIILANIFADVLTASFPKMKRLLAPDGLLILSGILDKSAPALLDEGQRHGFEFRQILKRGKWVTAVAQPRAA
ncbi:MAG: 50S ribosomal protein L11 methyltransferase [Verrucomicrobiales bacterium]